MYLYYFFFTDICHTSNGITIKMKLEEFSTCIIIIQKPRAVGLHKLVGGKGLNPPLFLVQSRIHINVLRFLRWSVPCNKLLNEYFYSTVRMFGIFVTMYLFTGCNKGNIIIAHTNITDR